MSERTFSGATIAISASRPFSYDEQNYAALPWTEICVDAIPPIKREFNGAEKKTTCPTVNRKRKASSIFGDMIFNFDPSDNQDAHDILLAAFLSKAAEISVRVKFAPRAGETEPEVRYTTAQVAGYAETNGGDEDTIDLKEVIMWIQRDVIRGSYIATQYDYNPYYTRPSDWLSLPVLSATDEKIVMLVAVYDHSSNFVAFKCTGDYLVDWGDGSAPENVASGVQAERILNYADFSGTECSRGYRQAIVTITPQVAGGLLTAELAQKHSAAASSYYSTALDIIASAENITKLTMLGSSYQTSLEILTLKRNSITNMQQMFSYCYSLQSVPLFDTSSVTNMYQMFYACHSLQSVPLFDTSSVTNMYRMFYSCHSLQSVPLFDTSSVTNMYRMFYSCHSLQSVPLFDTSSVTNMQQMFYNCYSLQSVPLFDTAAVTNMQQMFYNCYSLSRSKIINTSVDISYEDCKLAATELNEIFTNLATVSGKTITITGNWGAATCDTTIATNKGWTVIN